MVERRAIDAADAPAPAGGYAQVVEVTDARRLVFVSGQIPAGPDGTVPAGFADQARAAWANVEAQLRAADMTLDHVVKLTIYLSSRDHAMENRAIRREFLGDRKVAMTVVIAGIFDEAWLLEIEAVAAG
jgi:enamine deaminase RidA (YjgF/YER057c/UK114 family)